MVEIYFVNSQHSSIEELKGAITGMGGKENQHTSSQMIPPLQLIGNYRVCKKSSYVKRWLRIISVS